MHFFRIKQNLRACALWLAELAKEISYPLDASSRNRDDFVSSAMHENAMKLGVSTSGRKKDSADEQNA